MSMMSIIVDEVCERFVRFAMISVPAVGCVSTVLSG